MIVYDKEQKEIVIPNGIGNINLYNNGVEAGYNQGYEQGQTDMAAKARVLDVTENGVYRTKFSDPIPPELVTGVYADGTEFHNYAELNGKVFNTKIAGSVDSRLEFWYKGDNTLAGDAYNVIIGSGNNDDSDCFQVRYVMFTNNNLSIGVGNSIINFGGWDDTVWHHLIISKEEGLWTDGKKRNWDFSPTNTVNGEFFINGINYDINSDRAGTRNANGCFGMIKIDDTIIIPTADGFLNTNTGELLEVVKDGSYTFRENDPIYGEGELYKTINVNVPDLNGSYDEGYAQGKTDGINEQKSKLESINITENGTYRKEDGYNEVVVNVADLNGSYDEGYEQGQADVAANARVLEVTENGNYLSKFSDPVIPANVTGVYADGTNFYSYAELTNIVYNTGIKVSENTKIEIWYKPRDLGFITYGGIIGPIEDTSDNAFNIHTYIGDGFNNSPIGDVFNGRIKFYNSYYKPNDLNKWFHLELSFADGFIIDGVVVGTYTTNTSNYGRDIYINKYDQKADGYYGMIKIDDVVIIPTADGFQNVNTGELLEVVENGSYVYTNNEIIQGEGELYKTINVNVLPKVNVKEAGLKFGFSAFKEVPEWADFDGVTDMGNMFRNCSNLQTIPLIDTSKVTDANYMFYVCNNLKTLPNNLNFGNCTNFGSMFNNTGSLTDFSFLETWVINPNANMDNMINNTNITYVPAIPCVGNSGFYQSAIFWSSGDYSKLTYFGGWIGRKYNVDKDRILKKMTALSYESCISILNNLYDFTGNGETPNNDQGHLKVAQSFIDKVGDEISIGINKGWVISA